MQIGFRVFSCLYVDKISFYSETDRIIFISYLLGRRFSVDVLVVWGKLTFQHPCSYPLPCVPSLYSILLWLIFIDLISLLRWSVRLPWWHFSPGILLESLTSIPKRGAATPRALSCLLFSLLSLFWWFLVLAPSDLPLRLQSWLPLAWLLIWESFSKVASHWRLCIDPLS